MLRLRQGMIGLAAALAIAVAGCGGDDGGKKDDFGSSSDQSHLIPKDKVKPVNVVLAGGDWSIGPNNFVFGITDGSDEPQGGAKAIVQFYDIQDINAPKPVGAPMDAIQSAPGVGTKVAHLHAGGETHVHGGENEDRVGYYTTTNFDHAGNWGVSVAVTLKDGTKGTSNVAFQVSAKPKMPAPGQAAPKSNNLTKKDVADVREIDSGDPPNNMHDAKIKDDISAGKPMVIVFSTPAFCTSRFCGPVTEEVEDLQVQYRDRVDFVHIEIWRDFDTGQLNPTAKEWLVQPDGSISEPIVYVVDKNGTIFNRWEGPSARNIIEPSVIAVAGGQVYPR